MRALAKAPGERFETAASFRDAILAAYAQPVDATVSEATVILSSGPRHRARDGSRSPTAKAGSPSGSTSWPPGWEATTLALVENHLARVVGPMARVLVRRAARTCGDLDTLLKILADRLDIEDRAAFLASVPASVKASVDGSRAHSTPEPVFANSRVGAEPTGLTSRQIERVAQLLATYVGPSARMIVKRASDRTSDLEQFYRLVSESIPGQPDREAFLRDVRVAR
jgi:serine/threonine-protein kinase